MALRAIKPAAQIADAIRPAPALSPSIPRPHVTAVRRRPAQAARRLPAHCCAASGSISSGSSLATRCARGKAPRRPIKLGLRLFVCMRFQDLFHSPPGVLFAFPSRYWFTIGRLRVFSLGGWSPHLQTGFHVSRPTSLAPGSTCVPSGTGLSPTAAGLSRPFP